MEHINLTRRTLLKTSAAAGGGLVIGVYLPGASRIAEAAAVPTKLNAFVKIGTDGKVTFVTGTSEMGQGSHNALAMMIAEELEVDFKDMRIEQGGVDPAFGNPRWAGFKARGGFQYTTGSSAVRNVGVRVRYAGAAARFMLISAGAERMQVLRSECVAENGFVVHKSSGRKVSYGAIANDAAKMIAPDEPALKQPSEFKIIGKRTPRHDTPPKVSGKAVFGIDVKVPNMLTATVVHCPVFGGKVASFDASRTKAVTGVRQVVQISSGIAVVADHFWAAKKGADALKITWDEGPYANLNSADIRRTFTELAKKPGKVRRNDGDANKALEQAPRKIEAVYEVPFLDPACMEPMNATAHWKGDSVEVWAPTQAQSNNQQGIMDLTGLPREKITLHTTYLGGGFGRRAYNDFVLEAVETSKAVGKPVKLIWTRAEDMQHSMYRPSTYNVLTAALAPDGMPLAWKHHIVGPSILSYLPSINHLLKDGMDATSVAGAADVFPYAIPNVFVDYVLHNPGVPVGFWRSVGNSQNGYIMESFIDELAHAAGKDPYQYRRQLLAKHPRFIGVLDLAADKAGWGKPAPAGVHRGIATAYSYGSHVAQVAEVSVAKDGKVKVHRVVCAVDPGWVVNPDTFTAQMESGILYGLSGALFGEITIKNGRVEQSNFHDYPLPRMTDMPKIEVYFLKGEGEQGGAGEPGVPAAAPAVVNAIFAATGKRIRKLPIKPEMLRT
jgi:isoquinoline 1-oxidoreductase beta subunit